MATRVNTTVLDLPECHRPRASDRLPMGLALPIIGVLSMIGWFGAWQLGALIVRFFS